MNSATIAVCAMSDARRAGPSRRRIDTPFGRRARPNGRTAALKGPRYVVAVRLKTDTTYDFIEDRFRIAPQYCTRSGVAVRLKTDPTYNFIADRFRIAPAPQKRDERRDTAREEASWAQA